MNHRSLVVSMAIAVASLIPAPMAAQYCVPTGGVCSVGFIEYISNVTIGTINNTHACVTYGDFSATHQTPATVGVPITLTVSITDFFTGDVVRAFIDWDGDFTFESAVTLSGGATQTAMLTPPAYSVANVRLRVRMEWFDTPQACGANTSGYGGAEDYTLLVGGGGPTNPTAYGWAPTDPVLAGTNVNLVVGVTPGTSPPSTGITVTADLSAIGGSASQAFTDNMNTTFSYPVALPSTLLAGQYSLPFTVSDAQMRSSNDAIILTVSPPNDDCDFPIALSNGENGPYSNFGAGYDIPGPFHAACGGAFHDVFFTWTAPAGGGGNVEIKTCDPVGFVGTNQDTNLTVWASSDCPSPAGPPIACSEDAGPGCGTLGWQSSVSFAYSAGATYLVRVGSFSNADQGTFKITVTAVGAASKSQIGPGCSDGGGAGPTLDLDAPPVLGSTRIISITGAAPAAPGILMMSPPGTPSALTGGCTLYLSGSEITFLFFLGTSGAGSWSTPVSVPSDPNLEGVHVFVQGVIFPPSLIPFYQVTSGLDLELGY